MSFQDPSIWDLNVLIFLGKRWVSLGRMLSIESSMAWNRLIPCKILKINHNYLIFLFYYRFLLRFLVISISIDLRFDYIEFFGKRWYSLGKVLSIDSAMSWNRESLKKNKNHSQLPNILFFYHFLLQFLIISKSTELRFDYIDFFGKRWDSLEKASYIESDMYWNRVTSIQWSNYTFPVFFFFFSFLMLFVFVSKILSKVIYLFIWGKICVRHWVSYSLKQGNPLQNF